ncbi:MAG: hypothetical protein R3D55_23270 [Chloroflexota bacterium]
MAFGSALRWAGSRLAASFFSNGKQSLVGVDNVADAALRFDLNGCFAKAPQRHQHLRPRRIRLADELLWRSSGLAITAMPPMRSVP